MSFVDLSVLYPLVNGKCKRAPQPAVMVALVDAAREFCMESRFRQQAVSVDLVANQPWYTLASPSIQEEVIGVESVQYNGDAGPYIVKPANSEDVADYNYTNQRPCYFFFEPPDYMHLTPAPSANLVGGLSVMLVLQPTNTATMLDSAIVQRHGRDIANGALAFLFDSYGAEWENPNNAVRYRDMFMTSFGRGQAERGAGFRPNGVLTKVHRF